MIGIGLMGPRLSAARKEKKKTMDDLMRFGVRMTSSEFRLCVQCWIKKHRHALYLYYIVCSSLVCRTWLDPPKSVLVGKFFCHGIVEIVTPKKLIVQRLHGYNGFKKCSPW